MSNHCEQVTGFNKAMTERQAKIKRKAIGEPSEETKVSFTLRYLTLLTRDIWA